MSDRNPVQPCHSCEMFISFGPIGVGGVGGFCSPRAKNRKTETDKKGNLVYCSEYGKLKPL